MFCYLFSPGWARAWHWGKVSFHTCICILSFYSHVSMFHIWLYFQVNSVDLDPTNTLVVTGTMDGKCTTGDNSYSIRVFLCSVRQHFRRGSELYFANIFYLAQFLYGTFFGFSLCNLASYTGVLALLGSSRNLPGRKIVWRIQKASTSFCQALSPLVEQRINSEV